MVKSMTGFGSSEQVGAGWNIRAEVKAVNHRYGEIIVRLPRQFNSVEETVRAEVQKNVTRGRVEVFLNFEETGEKKSIVKLDKDLALAYHKILKDLADSLGEEHQVSVFQLAQLPEVLTVEEEDLDLETIKEIAVQAVDGALQKLNQMRTAEGQELARDLFARLSTLKGLAEKIKDRAPLIVKEHQQKITERMQELLQHIPVDENRLAMEIAIFADKASIEEELVRLDSHCRQFILALSSEETIGRKLDFLVQEMNREVNTIGSKANDLAVSHLVVEAKSELEKIREQVQNIE
jgi:uncharacterized protein (TIGR00255 family)